MSARHEEMFRELVAADFFDSRFDAVEASIVSQWRQCGDAAGREELWQRQRALRDLRREFNKYQGEG